MTVIIRLKPRATTVYENLNQERIKPNANTTDFSTTLGFLSLVHLGADADELEETVTRVRTRGVRPNALPAVSTATGGGNRPLSGEQLGNKTFTLRGGAEATVAEIYAFVFIDPDNSILGNGADGTVTVNYLDDTSTARSDAKTLSIDGRGPHYTSFAVAEVTSVVGTAFSTVGAGAPTANDQLLLGPACPDTLHDILANSGLTDAGPAHDPQDGGGVDGDGSYVQADSTSDQRIYASFPSIDSLIPISIVNVQFHYYWKNVGATSNGIEGIIRTSGGGGDTVVVTAFTTTGTEGGQYTLRSSSVLATNPITASAWTIAELNSIQQGVRFKGDSPTVPKRCAFMRMQITLRVGFLHPSIDGTNAANMDEAWQVVAKDPFVTPSDDDTQHIRAHGSVQNEDLRFNMESLPAEATTVDQVETRVRFTYRHVGDVNGSGEADTPCGIGTNPRSNAVGLNQLEGPREQINNGGAFIVHDLPSTIAGATRHLVGPGDPSGGCGPSGNFPGDNVGFGTYIEKSLISVLNSSSLPISPVQVNSMTAGIRLSEEEVPEYRISRIYSEVLFRRNPVGESFFHLAVDDDPGSPDDGTRMVSQHSTDKDFGVDFSGIPEVTKIYDVTAIVRGKRESGAAAGWRVIWRRPGQSDIVEAIETNTSFENKSYVRTVSPWTTLEWTREEVNSLQIIWRSQGENAYFEKEVSAIALDVEVDLLPAKIDNARRLASEQLLMLGKPIPMLSMRLPLEFGDVGLMRDIAVSHRAIPRTKKTLSLERWDRSLMRVFTKVWELETDTVRDELYDLRDYLVTFLFTGQTTKKGRSFDGMMVVTNGVTVQYSRTTNDYIEDPFAHRLQELSADEPPAGLNGILVLNGITNRILNGGFGEGATNVFTNWAKFGTGLAGAIIAEDIDPLKLAWDPEFAGAPQRSLKFTGATSPGDVYIEQQAAIPQGAGLSPEGSRYVVSILHEDDSGAPISYAVNALPAGIGERFHNVFDQTWITTGGVQWFTLPVRNVPTLDRIIGNLDNLETMTQSPSSATIPIKLKLGVRHVSNQVNHLYGVQIEGGTLESGEERGYASSMILTKTGPVVRAIGVLKVPNISTHPTYYFTRGTFFCIAEPQWDSADLPEIGTAKRYIYSMVTDASNHELLYYNQATESFVYERRVAGTTYSAAKYFPAVVRGVPIRLATRWISNLGDLGEAAFSTAIFVNDIRGTAGAPPSTPTAPASVDFYIGTHQGTDGTAFDGVISRIRITQQALPDEKIRRLR